ncbi:hypothetical protein DVU_1216 [Nitratidesulfovibrio vulgaris str. Hildenborough]|uniref:Uncharacterized protein n=1 Tax=Nitratidesulfovibrio vulgaris (strain ATCC 29579 / DSM 644 / CCUG 34227 / NCIMB 8303 / VKM B-1760 / Hildenborough) TaxID=882 RepID=Q72CR7_NITV2|nr:hypothetical protein DVU_1216 [Nitratidesulfovibrio vulgaris str. Hildenborough]
MSECRYALVCPARCVKSMSMPYFSPQCHPASPPSGHDAGCAITMPDVPSPCRMYPLQAGSPSIRPEVQASGGQS